MYLPPFLLIMLMVRLEEMGITTPPSKGGNDVWPLFLAIFGGFGLTFLFNYGRRPGRFLDNFLDKILKSSGKKIHKAYSGVKTNYSIKNFFSKKNNTKLSLIIISLLCLFEMPYWYFQLFSIFGTIGFTYLAFLDYKEKLKFTPQLFMALAIVINPVIKISFDRESWEYIDIILATILFLSFFETVIRKNKQVTNNNL